MKSEILIQKYESFQPEIQKEILDFIEYLELKYKAVQKGKKEKKPAFEKEPFVGMWSSRSDMKDPKKYIRELRQKHWKKS